MMEMRSGMLWFDSNDRRDLADKIARAAEYYQSKYGERPSLCLIHPSTLMNESPLIEGVEVEASNSVLPNHFYLGTPEIAASTSRETVATAA